MYGPASSLIREANASGLYSGRLTCLTLYGCSSAETMWPAGALATAATATFPFASAWAPAGASMPTSAATSTAAPTTTIFGAAEWRTGHDRQHHEARQGKLAHQVRSAFRTRRQAPVAVCHGQRR